MEARVAASTTPRRDWQRAKIVLMAAEGASSPVIGAAVGLNRNRVDVWRRRWRDGGVEGLADRARSGRPRVYGPQERLALVKTITTRPAEPGQRGGRRLKARMSMPEAARLLRERHGIAIPESLQHPNSSRLPWLGVVAITDSTRASNPSQGPQQYPDPTSQIADQQPPSLLDPLLAEAFQAEITNGGLRNRSLDRSRVVDGDQTQVQSMDISKITLSGEVVRSADSL